MWLRARETSDWALPGSEPADAAATPAVSARTGIAIPAAFKVKNLPNIDFLPPKGRVVIWDPLSIPERIASPIAETVAAWEDSSVSAAEAFTRWITPAIPANCGGASFGWRDPDSSLSTVVSSIGNRLIYSVRSHEHTRSLHAAALSAPSSGKRTRTCTNVRGDITVSRAFERLSNLLGGEGLRESFQRAVLGNTNRAWSFT